MKQTAKKLLAMVLALTLTLGLQPSSALDMAQPGGDVPAAHTAEQPKDTCAPVGPEAPADTAPLPGTAEPDSQPAPEAAEAPGSLAMPLKEPEPTEPGEVGTVKALKDMSTGSYVLTGNIDLTSQNWVSMNFDGTLDGAGHTITLDGAPLFGDLSGTVTNLVLAGTAAVTEDILSGPLALTVTSTGEVRNCASTASFTLDTSGWASNEIGGLVGSLNGGTISNCVVAGALNGGFSRGGVAADGASGSTLQSCYWSMKNAAKASAGWGGVKPQDCAKMSEADMQLEGFLATLNAQRQECDQEWGLAAEDGLPAPGGEFPGKELDTSTLETAVAAARKIINIETEPYTSDSWRDFADALAEAEAILKGAQATQSQVNAAADKLAEAQAVLTKLDLTALKEKIAEAEGLDNTGNRYTPDSWAALVTALNAAKELLKPPVTITQRQVNDKATALTRAISGLQEDQFDKTNRKALTEAIAEAETVDPDKIYTKASMTAFQAALKNADAVNTDRAANQDVIDGAAAELTKAVAELAERRAAMVEIPNTAIHIKEPKQLLSLEDGKYYILDRDMELYVDVKRTETLTERLWEGAAMNCVLDGQGHTLTLVYDADNPHNSGMFDKVMTAKAVFTSIGPDGVVQNLGVNGKTLRSQGALTDQCEGLIANCWTQINLGPARGFGGLVGKLDSGGMLLNSYGVAKAGLDGKDVGLAASADSNSLIQNCYWAAGQAAVESGTPKVVESAAKTEAEFTAADGVVTLLNDHRGGLGAEWHRDGKGYPYFGEEKDFQPPQVLDVTLTLVDGNKRTFSSKDGLALSVFDADGAGTFGAFSCDKYTENVSWRDVSGATSSDRRPVSISNKGTLSLYDGPGETKIGLFDQSGHELTRFSLSINTEGTVTDTRLTLSESKNGGLSYDKLEEQDGVRTVAGRVVLKADVEVKLEGKSQYQTVYPGLLDYESSDIKTLSYAYSNYLNTKNAGTAALTITAKAPLTHIIGRQTANITTTYVPVESVSLTMDASYEIHDRTAPTTEAPGTFVPISLSSPTFTPDNASYQDDWTITSSNPSVANYLTTMVYGFVAEKAGTTTFTVTTQDPNGAPVTISKEVAFTYRNPVTQVTLEDGQTDFTVPVGDTIELPLVWKGLNDSEDAPCHVSEADMVWTVEGPGKVQLTRAGKSVESDYPKEKWVSNPMWRVTGTGEGNVTITGRPVDQTQKAAPITFSVHVTAGGPQEPVDHDALIQTGITGAQSFLNKKTPSYVFGKEWEVFALSRSGGSIATADVEKYLDSVAKTYEAPGTDPKKPTTIARVAVALGALNQDASSFRGLDLIGMLCGSDKITDGSNEAIWALIALDTRGYEVSQGAAWDREKLLEEILRYQNAENGGFGLTDNQATSVDMTAMALQALAPYQQSPGVVGAVSKALDYLRKAQTFDGGFGNLESAAQVLTALSALGLDPLDPENGFVQAAGDLVTNIMSYHDEESGGFRHASGSEAEPMSSVQALYSLEACRRFNSGEKRLYDLTDADPRAVLVKRLAEAEKLVEKDYTSESWSIFAGARSAAKAVLDQPDATDEALAAASGALADAIAGLKRVEDGGGDKPEPGDTITVSFRLVGAELSHGNVDLGAGTGNAEYKTWIKTQDYTMKTSSTMYDLFTKALNEAGLQYEGAESNYVRTIHAPGGYGGYALSEFTNGKYSGWMYTVNGSHPDVGLQYYKLKDGADVVWHYVNDYRYEVRDWNGGSLGDSGTWNGWLKAPDINPPSKPADPGKEPGKGDETADLRPTASSGANGEAKAQLGELEISKAVDRAMESGAAFIIIEPLVEGTPAKVTVTLPKRSLAEIADKTSAGVVVKTAAARISIPGAALAGLAKEQGKTVSISAETLKGQDGRPNGQIAIGLQVDGRTQERVAGGITLAISAEEPSAGSVMIQVTDGGDKIIRKSAVDGQNLNALLDGAATVTIQDNDTRFQDVPEEYWGRDAVSFAVSHELFQGTGGDTFDPSGDMTRSMLATVLWRLEGEAGTEGAAAFSDVDGGWYAQAADWAAERGIVNGDGGRFYPNGAVTREELATILYRYAGREEPNSGARDGLERFSDGEQLSLWARDAMEWAVGAGLIAGKGDGTLDPTGRATRAETAAVLQRLVDHELKRLNG